MVRWDQFQVSRNILLHYDVSHYITLLELHYTTIYNYNILHDGSEETRCLASSDEISSLEVARGGRKPEEVVVLYYMYYMYTDWKIPQRFNSVNS